MMGVLIETSACNDNCSTTMDNMTSYAVANDTGISQVAMDVYNAYLFFVMLIGLPGNTLVLMVFAKHKPNTTTDWFILFITFCDFVTLVINVPVYITLSTGVWYLYGNTAICLVHMFVSQSVVLSSSFLICGLALDRYFRICKPMMTYSTSRARNTCVTIIILTTALSLPCFVMYESTQDTCRSSLGIGLFIYYLMLFLTFLIAAFIVVISYIKVNARIKETENSITRFNSARVGLHGNGGRFSSSCRKLNQVVPSSDPPVGTGYDTEQLDPDNVIQVSTISGKSPASATKPDSSSAKSSSVVMETRKRYRQASILTTKISFLVCAVFIISWIPPWTTFVIVCLNNSLAVIPGVLMFLRVTHLLNTASNPILYAWFNRKFRNHMLKILCCKTI